jgi:phosphoserine phosphatase
MVPHADGFVFDVDSTVVKTEGIDILGKCFGVYDEIAALTRSAMGGDKKFEDAMVERLQLLADRGMTRAKLDSCVSTDGAPQWSPGIQDLVKALHAHNIQVYLLSGGFYNMILPIAKELNISTDHVFANEILFDKDGNYAGFDRDAPTSASGGKPAVLQLLMNQRGYKTMIMVGDGATDLEARTLGPASAFIGYGGVVERPAVKAAADWYIKDFKVIYDLLVPL